MPDVETLLRELRYEDPIEAERENPTNDGTPTDCLASPDAQGPVDEPEPRDLGDDPDPSEVEAVQADGGAAPQSEEPAGTPDIESPPEPSGAASDGPPPPPLPPTAREFAGDEEPGKPEPSSGGETAAAEPSELVPDLHREDLPVLDEPATVLAETDTVETTEPPTLHLPPVPTEPLPDIEPAPGTGADTSEQPAPAAADTPAEAASTVPPVAPIEPATEGMRIHHAENDDRFDTSSVEVLVEGNLVGPEGQETFVKDSFTGNIPEVGSALTDFIDRAVHGNGATAMDLIVNDIGTLRDLQGVVGQDAITFRAAGSNPRPLLVTNMTEFGNLEQGSALEDLFRTAVRRGGLRVQVDLSDPDLRARLEQRRADRARPEGE